MMLVRCQIADHLRMRNVCIASSYWLRDRFQLVLVAGHMTCLGREGSIFRSNYGYSDPNPPGRAPEMML